MKCRIASADDCLLLAEWNHQLIQDEGHRNSMTIVELEGRMRGWLASGEYQAVIFDDDNETVAYALFRQTEAEIYLRQFFVVRHRRREGFGRRAIRQLFAQFWTQEKRWTIEVLLKNTSAVSFWRSLGYNDYSLMLEIMPGDKLTSKPGD